jgi:putative PIN family toxin of toxin-antitoxin system
MAIKHIVFDSNTWITYFYNNQFTELADIVTIYGIDIYTCEKQLQEITSVIKRPKLKARFSPPFNRYANFVKLVAKNTEIDERFDRALDEKDNYLVDLAYTVKADHIVSSDPHLLSLKHVGKIQIISLSQFKRKLGLAY